MVQQIRRQYEAENNRKLQKEKVCMIGLFHKRPVKHDKQSFNIIHRPTSGIN